MENTINIIRNHDSKDPKVRRFTLVTIFSSLFDKGDGSVTEKPSGRRAVAPKPAECESNEQHAATHAQQHEHQTYVTLIFL